MDLKNTKIDLDNITKDNNNNNDDYIENNNKENNPEEDVYFYIMTLQADGQRHQIKIYENSNASELAFNFCKTYNLDFPTMKYLKKCIKQIIVNFNIARKNEMIYLLKDNSSIQEVAEEEIITDNSLKKSGTYKKNNSNNINTNNEDNSKIKKNISKENILSLLSDKKSKNNSINNDNHKKLDKKKIYQKFEEKNNLKNNEKDKITNEDEGIIELKDYSIDYLENESVEIFPPTEHTTKIEQKSSIKNSYSFNQKKNLDYNDKKRNSKNKKLQLNKNNNNDIGINYNKINKKQNCLFNLNKSKKEKNKNNDISDSDFKNILIKYKDYKDINIKEKNKTKSKSKSKSKDKEKNFIKKNNYIHNDSNNKKPKSLEKIKKKINNKTTYIDNNNKKQEKLKHYRYNIKINKHEKNITSINMNEIKNKCLSNYYDYFMKAKNFMAKNNMIHKYQTSSSINQDSIRSKSISRNKIKKKLTQKISYRNKTKKEKSMIHLSTLNHQKNNNTSKINLNTILKKDSFSKDKQQRTVFKNKIKPKYNIICNKNKNNNLFNKTINGQCLTSRTKNKKNINGKELFMESKNINSNGIRKMVTESLLNIHKYKEQSKDKDKNKKNIFMNGGIIKCYNNSINKKSRNKEILFKNETNIEKSINLQEQLYFEYGNNNMNNIINNINIKNKRNITDANLVHKKTNIKNEIKKNS